MSIIQEIKESWGWIGIDPIEVVGGNEFGNLMIKDSQGKYWRLCPEDLYCKVVANGREELNCLSKDQEFLEDWYMQALVEQAKEKYGPLPDQMKYCLITPGPCGGEYAILNINIAHQIELVRFSGDLAKKIKDLPEGAHIQLKVVD
ncbi:T6SS immunity protein Tdi1 domain-containing protein [Zooshikella sp. RANM57]|uniref:T6SS immunity protein Tdi1 domain-containing protein n=1 Tax=Zooshikella sp. RANM57 TaxID=3425863 RepID=UPI003D6FBA7B